MDEASAKKLIEYILKTVGINGNTIVWSDSISSYAMDELEYLLDRKYNYFHIQDALINLKKMDHYNISDVTLFLDNAKKKDNKIIAMEKIYSIFIPISIEIEESFNINFNSKLIRLLKAEEANKIISTSYFESKEFYKEKEIYQIETIPSTYIYLKIKATDEITAASKSYMYYYLIKSILELIVSWRTQYIIHNASYRAKIGPAIWLLTKDRNKISFQKLDVYNSQNHLPIQLNKRNIEDITWVLNAIKNYKNESSIDFLIYRNILLYNDALEQIDDSYCFLAFWQILENISLSEYYNGKTDIVVKRISPITISILNINLPLERTLKVFAEKRCELVHKGITRITNDDINKIKLICELSISWLIKNRQMFRTKNTLEEYYKIRSNDDSSIKSIKTAIDIVAKEKRKIGK